MYDSDEVRDAVRREMMTALLTPGAAVALSALDRAAMDEARAAYAAGLQEALRAYLGNLEARRREQEEWAARVREALNKWGAELRAVLEQFGQALRELGERIVDGITEALAWPKPETEPFAWQRRPRRPEVKPARGVDPVAAGRQPAVVMRTRIRGGRR